MKAAIIEIQGEVIHGSGAVLDQDAERMTALQSMDFDVFLVAHDMLNDKKTARRHSQKRLQSFGDSI